LRPLKGLLGLISSADSVGLDTIRLRQGSETGYTFDDLLSIHNPSLNY